MQRRPSLRRRDRGDARVIRLHAAAGDQRVGAAARRAAAATRAIFRTLLPPNAKPNRVVALDEQPRPAAERRAQAGKLFDGEGAAISGKAGRSAGVARRGMRRSVY